MNYIEFPDPENSSEDGLVAMGGELSSDMILSAYMQGIFPWFNQNDPILWWSPNPRMVLYPEKFKVSGSLRQSLGDKNIHVEADTRFAEVISRCASVIRKGQKGTWITNEMKAAYIKLHEEGFAHSVEVCENGMIIGGLYGLAIGKVFFGESMFHLKPNASKIALHALCKLLVKNKFHFIDVQQSTSHLASLGAENISRHEFLIQLKNAIAIRGRLGKWHL